MDFESDLSQSTEYKSFRSTVPLKQVVVDNDGLKVSVLKFIHYIILFQYYYHEP